MKRAALGLLLLSACGVAGALPVYRGTLTGPGFTRDGVAVSVTPSPTSGMYIFVGLQPTDVLGLLAGQGLSFPGRTGTGKMTSKELTISTTLDVGDVTFNGQRE